MIDINGTNYEAGEVFETWVFGMKITDTNVAGVTDYEFYKK
ncbi:hypothetical protein GCM10022392_29550 [Mucilaginibacter panaciglaebae]|uniref:Uncharacterized protein n=1 Tax=Mucilaginibacter panaciglaebae TaxID=502331 RepID=A0ABP7X206_9SPHI